MFDIGTREIIIIAVVLVLLFGSSKIPQLAKGIAEAVKTIRESFSTIDDKKSSKK
jgi:sec-independent protein translocase protein TatA